MAGYRASKIPATANARAPRRTRAAVAELCLKIFASLVVIVLLSLIKFVHLSTSEVIQAFGHLIEAPSPIRLLLK
jgi:hypothetical protein